MPVPEQHPERPASHLEKEEAWLWRTALLFLVLFATTVAALLWERLHALPYHLGLLPVAILFVAICFVAFAYGRRRQVSELKEPVSYTHLTLPTILRV